MWTYDLLSGWIYEQGRKYTQATGRLPVGLYTMSQGYNDPMGGDMCLRLTAAPTNPDKNRYLIYGSNGVGVRGIILPHVARAYINASPDRHLTVVASVDADNPPIREHIIV